MQSQSLLPRRVVFYLSDLKSGGTEWFALRLARGLAREGYAPVFLVARARGELLPLIEKEFEIVGLSGFGYNPLGIAKVVPATRRFLRRLRPEAIVSGLPLMNIALAWAARKVEPRPRLIMIEHMRLVEENEKNPVRLFFKKRFLRWAYAQADEIVAVSRTAAADLETFCVLPPGRVKTIYNPVIPDDVDVLAREAPPHAWLGRKSAPVIVAVGRLLKVKDYPTLLRAFADMRKAIKARLLIFGEGSERKRLAAMIRALGIEDSVGLPGATENVFAALRAADVFVLSSSSESFGNVVAEALACGVPVVSTDCGGPREILEDGKWGVLVPPRDPLALTSALFKALAEKSDGAALAARGKSFSVRESVRRYKEII